MVQRSLLILAITVLLDALAVNPAWSHPHIFIMQRLSVVFDDKGMAGVVVRWKFDDMFAGMIAEDYDENGNGKLEPKEVLTIKEKAFSYISEFSYFNHIRIDGKPFTVKFIKDFNAVLTDGRLVYEFFIPCHVTATNRMKKVAIGTYDPTYYAAIFFAKNNPVALEVAEGFEVKTTIREDPETKIYFDMIHPWTLFLELRKK